MMRAPTWKPVKLGTFEGFEVELSFEEEDESPRKHFIDFCGWTKEEYSKISNCYWFCVKITAYKGTIECGTVYLGGNCYANLKEVLGDYKNNIDTLLSGYGLQLIEEATTEAKEALNTNRK